MPDRRPWPYHCLLVALAAAIPIIPDKDTRSERLILKKNFNLFARRLKYSLNFGRPCIWPVCHHVHGTSFGTRDL